MVRLKSSPEPNTTRKKRCFNSYMVRLKYEQGNVITPAVMFQFLYGTIKIFPIPLSRGKLAKFQFLYGTIKIPPKKIKTIFLLSFQFLYGTIKIKKKIQDVNKAIRFQFLYGTIKIAFLKSETLPVFSFQFLYGTIKIRLFPCLAQYAPTVSIPIWYD